MRNIILTALAITLMSVVGVTSLGSRHVTYAAATKDDVCAGLGDTGGSCDPASTGGQTVEGAVQVIVNIVSWVVGIIAVVMVIVGGAKYVMSGGDSSGVQSAKNTIMYALIGIVIVALAQVIVKFTVHKATTTTTNQQACTTTITTGCIDPATGDPR